jgi:hypothetical protein
MNFFHGPSNQLPNMRIVLAAMELNDQMFQHCLAIHASTETDELTYRPTIFHE